MKAILSDTFAAHDRDHRPLRVRHQRVDDLQFLRDEQPNRRGLPAAFIAAGTATMLASLSLWQVPKASLT